MADYRVMVTEKFDDAIFYRVGCDCGEPSCDLTLVLEKDKELPEFILLNFYENMEWCSYWVDDNKWYKNFWSRIKAACKILFTGYISVENTLVLRGEKHIDSFIKALEEGKQYLKGKNNANNL